MRARHQDVKLSLAVYGRSYTFNPETRSRAPGFHIASPPFNYSQLKVLYATGCKVPHSRNVLATSGNARAMLICSSSYAIRGFPAILFFCILGRLLRKSH